MSSCKNNSSTSATVVLVIFLLLSQMHPPVTGRSLISKSEGEKTPDLDSTSLPTFGFLLTNGKQKHNFDGSSIPVPHEQPTKRNPGGDGHLSDALLRLLRIQNMDEDGEAVVEFVDTSDPAVRTRLSSRFGKRSMHSSSDFSSRMG